MCSPRSYIYMSDSFTITELAAETTLKLIKTRHKACRYKVFLSKRIGKSRLTLKVIFSLQQFRNTL